MGSVVLDFNGNQLNMTFLDDDDISPNVLDYLTMIKGEDQPLPVTLTFFRIRENKPEKAVLLEWKTDSEVNKHFPGQVFKSIIPRSVRLAEAPSYGLPISAYAPTSVGAMAYEALAKELVKSDGVKAH